MNQALTEDVRQLYEQYPFPHGFEKSRPDFVFTYVMRVHFPPAAISGWRVLDAGCGTGHKLIALALSFPKTRFTGIDLSRGSLAVAERLAAEYRVPNVTLRHGDLMTLDLEERFDLVQSIGVIHHLEDPLKGLRNLCRVLKDGGLLSLWFYHPFGECDRLIQRELLLTLWRNNWRDMAQGQALMEALGLALPATYYGPQGIAGSLEGNADAFMHPIVHAYRFDEVFQMLRIAGQDWAAVDFINLESDVKFINLGDTPDDQLGGYCIREEDLLHSGELVGRYRQLSGRERLRVIELTTKPRGFQVYAGKGPPCDLLGERIRGNVISLCDH